MKYIKWNDFTFQVNGVPMTGIKLIEYKDGKKIVTEGLGVNDKRIAIKPKHNIYDPSGKLLLTLNNQYVAKAYIQILNELTK